MQYDVTALSPDHLIIKFSIEAPSDDDARRQVEARGYHAATLIPKRRPSSNKISRFGKSHFPIMLFSQEILALLRAGLSIVEGLEALLEKETNEKTRIVLSRLLASLHEGKRFSQALAEQSETFSPLYVGIIKAAEGTSDLPKSIARFIDYQKRIDSVRNKVVSSTIYPIILLCVGSGVSIFLIGYVVPRFAQIYQDTGRNLPWLSRMLLNWGKFVALHTNAFLVGAIVGLGAFIFFIRQAITSGQIYRLLEKVPGVNERLRIYELSRLYLTLSMLLEGGISMVPAIESVQSVASSAMKSNLQNAKEAIQGGMSFSSAFELHQLTTPISLRMMRVGEHAGELGRMLQQSAEFYDDEIGRWIDRFTKTFEPLLMAAIGLIVGAIVVLLYMPIFDLAGSLT